MSTNGHGMSLVGWRAARRTELTLPSGLVVTLKRRGLKTLAWTGQIPAPLVALVSNLTKGNEKFEVDMKDPANIEKLPPIIEMMRAVARATIVDPPIGNPDEEDHLDVNDLEKEDLEVIFNWVTAPAEQMRPFRPEPDGDVELAPTGNSVPPAPEQVAGDS